MMTEIWSPALKLRSPGCWPSKAWTAVTISGAGDDDDDDADAPQAEAEPAEADGAPQAEADPPEADSRFHTFIAMST